jgi:hypothetical protein
VSLLTFMEDPTIPAWYKRKKWETAPQGAKNEYYYEKARNAGRLFLGGKSGDTPAPSVMAGKAKPDLNPLGTWLARQVVPEDLQSAGSLAGAVGGAFTGHPFLGAEAGGTLGGVAQGRGALPAAAMAAPGALTNWLLPKAVRTIFASRIAKAMSDRASGAIGESTAKLFNRLFADNPELEVPVSPEDLANFYGSGTASPAVQKTGKSLGDFRQAIKRQPAFQTAPPIAAPVKWIDPVTGTPRYGQVKMSLSDAIDYQQGLYGKGYLITGGPRGGIMAEPDRALASEMRAKILNSMKQIPRSGPHLAARYADLSHDYGVAQTVKDVFTKDTVTPEGLLNHEKVYGNLADQKRLSHLNSLVGPEGTRNYLADVAPGRQRIADPGAQHVGLHPPGIGARISASIPQAPTGPAAFTPQAPAFAGVIGSQAATQGIEKMSGGGE